MKQTIELMNMMAIPVIKQRIAQESEWLEKLQNDDTAATIIQYREYKLAENNFVDDEMELDKLCEKYFELFTQFMEISYECDRLQSNFTGDRYNVKASTTLDIEEKTEPTEEDLEDVELASDEEILKVADECENI